MAMIASYYLPERAGTRNYVRHYFVEASVQLSYINYYNTKLVVLGRWVGVERWLLKLFRGYEYKNVMVGEGGERISSQRRLYYHTIQANETANGSTVESDKGPCVRSVSSVVLWEHNSEHLGTHGGNSSGLCLVKMPIP